MNVAIAPPVSNKALSQQALTALQAKLADLCASGGEQFDPVRYHFIATMAERAAQQRPAVCQIVANRALQALADYQAQWERAREAAAKALDAASATESEHNNSLQQLFNQGDFKAVVRLAKRFSSAADSAANNTLAELNRSLHSEAPSGNREASGPSFDEYLQQQEIEVAKALASDAPAAQPGLQSTSAQPAAMELKSTRLLRQAQVKQRAEKFVRRAVQESPASPGPLNPQMLATRALTSIRDLSPQYLNRFVTYIDTLLWIEQVAPPAAASKDTKTKKKGKRKGG